MITFEDFLKVDMRVGKIISVAEFPEARKPAYKIKVDFGEEVGIKKSSAQLPHNYKPQELIDRLVIGVVNFPPKQIGPVMSEFLVLGVPDSKGEVVLFSPDQKVPLGGRVF